MRYTFVLGNAPSQKRFQSIRMQPSIGCNFGIKDHNLTHLVVADRIAVHEVRKLPVNSETKYWCKASPLETPPGWHDLEFPGLDSGSAALALAAELYPDNEIIAIGFDGVLGLDNGNAYEYRFRPNPKPEQIRHRHRETVEQIYPNLPRTRFVSYQRDPVLETISYDQALKIALTQSRSVYKEPNKTKA